MVVMTAPITKEKDFKLCRLTILSQIKIKLKMMNKSLETRKNV